MRDESICGFDVSYAWYIALVLGPLAAGLFITGALMLLRGHKHTRVAHFLILSPVPIFIVFCLSFALPVVSAPSENADGCGVVLAPLVNEEWPA